MVDGPEPITEPDDRGVVGDVDGLGADPRFAGVGIAQCRGVAPGDDDPCARVPGGKCHGHGDAAAAETPRYLTCQVG